MTNAVAMAVPPDWAAQRLKRWARGRCIFLRMMHNGRVINVELTRQAAYDYLSVVNEKSVLIMETNNELFIAA